MKEYTIKFEGTTEFIKEIDGVVKAFNTEPGCYIDFSIGKIERGQRLVISTDRLEDIYRLGLRTAEIYKEFVKENFKNSAGLIMP